MRDFLRQQARLSRTLGASSGVSALDFVDPSSTPAAGCTVIERIGRVVALRGMPNTLLASASAVLEVDRYEGQLEGEAGIEVAPVPYPTADRGAGVVLGLVDGGIDLLDDAFRRGDRTVVGALLDRREGRDEVLFQGELDAFTRARRIGTEHRVSLRDGGPSDQPTHGTDIARILAGGAPAGATSRGDRPRGLAPDAALGVVALPFGGNVGATEVMRALRFLDEYADERPLVVNLSFGMPQGSADGASLLELACDEFVGQGRRPGRYIVKSSGNGAREGRRIRRTVEPGARVGVTFDVLPGQSTFECWADGVADWQFRFAVDGRQVGELAAGSPTLTLTRDDLEFAGDIVSRHPSNGDTCVALTARFARAARLSVECSTNQARRSRLDWACSAAAFVVGATENETTITSPGNARHVLTVGGLRRGGVASFSARGPTRDGRRKPDAYAPGEVDLGADEVRVGTSYSAAQVSGYIACYLSHRMRLGLRPGELPNTLQLKSELRAATRLDALATFDGDESGAAVMTQATLAALASIAEAPTSLRR